MDLTQYKKWRKEEEEKAMEIVRDLLANKLSKSQKIILNNTSAGAARQFFESFIGPMLYSSGYEINNLKCSRSQKEVNTIVVSFDIQAMADEEMEENLGPFADNPIVCE